MQKFDRANQEQCAMRCGGFLLGGADARGRRKGEGLRSIVYHAAVRYAGDTPTNSLSYYSLDLARRTQSAGPNCRRLR